MFVNVNAFLTKCCLNVSFANIANVNRCSLILEHQLGAVLSSEFCPNRITFGLFYIYIHKAHPHALIEEIGFKQKIK